jgi:hypothetical protein
MTFREGMAVRRRNDLPAGVNTIWAGRCREMGLDPKGIFHVSAVHTSGFRVKELGATVLWAPYRFDMAPPPEKTLDDYM